MRLDNVSALLPANVVRTVSQQYGGTNNVCYAIYSWLTSLDRPTQAKLGRQRTRNKPTVHSVYRIHIDITANVIVPYCEPICDSISVLLT